MDRSQRKKHGKKLNSQLIVGIILLLLICIPVLISFFWLPYDVNAMDPSVILKSVSISHPFGTDNFGRDIFCRVILGTRATFLIAVFTVVAGAAIGTVVGALTGFYGGIVDEILMRVNDCLASFPSILLALVVVSLLDKGMLNVCIALTLVFIPSFARIMRSEFIEQSKRDYVLSARLMGASDLRIIFIHIFPNTVKALVTGMLVGLNNAVLAEAGLSFLGLGVEPPDPSLGRMLSEAQVYIWGAPWYVISASAVMVIMILGISLISENIGLPAYNLKKEKKKIAAALGEPGQDVKESGTGRLIEVRDLKAGFISDEGVREVINGISFTLDAGEILGMVGESGSGKSMTALTIMGIAPDNSVITQGHIYYNGRDITRISESEYCKLRGSEISMIFQEPMTSLNPLQTVGEQIDEVLDLHAAYLTAGEQRQRVIAAMADTGLKDPDTLYNKYPHELSGGMRQRIMIAMAVIAGAKVIIADEPTTALDAGLADVILEIFRNINKKYGTGILLISHDLEVIAKICGRAVVIKDGVIKEELTLPGNGDTALTDDGTKTGRVFSEPRTEYARKLLDAAYADRSYIEANEASDKPDVLVRLKDYSVYYRERTGLFGRKKHKQVNFGINMEIRRGDCVGIVGESGCGKTTFVKGIAGLQKYTDGICELSCDRPAFVFQDPLSSLNPSKTVGWILDESIKLNHDLTKEKRLDMIKRALEAVDLDDTMVERSVAELSGGEKQRVSIAESIVLNRELIILDEPVSALDVTIREQILELLMRLKKERDLTFIVISHDRRLITRICNRIYYMEEGRLSDALEEH